MYTDKHMPQAPSVKVMLLDRELSGRATTEVED